MSLSSLIDEFASVGLGDLIYDELLLAVKAVIIGQHYPPMYSPTGRWDEDAYVGLTHDWAMTRLLRRGYLEHILLTNETLSGFRKGLQLSFVHFLIGQKKRTILDNLFARTNAILETDDRFRCFVESTRKTGRYWGLASWQRPELYGNADAELIATMFKLPDVKLIRYRRDAKKLSPIISDKALAELLAGLLERVNALLNLEHFTMAFRYRFDLLQSSEEAVHESLTSENDAQSGLDSRILDAPSVEDDVVLEETAYAILANMSNRQQRILLEYAYPDATLESVAQRVGCSKSTVDNELRRALHLIKSDTETLDEARATYERVLLLLSDGEQG